MDRLHPITKALQAGVQRGIFPGAVLFVRLRNTILYHEAVGLTASLPSSPATHLNTLYDLASLTKPLATATAILCLVQDGLIHLDQPVASILRPTAKCPVGGATIRDLLCHRSGLPAWRPFYEHWELQNGQWSPPDSNDKRRDLILDKICHEPFEYQPRSKTLYSDLGFMLLGFAIEEKTNRSLGSILPVNGFFAPLECQTLIFCSTIRSLTSIMKRRFRLDIAPTEQDPWRGRLLQGEVHDENAYVLGGVAGHAGLFGTAEAVAVLTGAWLEGYWGRHSFFDQQLVKEFVATTGRFQLGIGVGYAITTLFLGNSLLQLSFRSSRIYRHLNLD